MSSLARQVLGASRKRREREGPDGGGLRAPPPKKARPDQTKTGPTKPSPLGWLEPSALPAKNRLLAGYLAHEFLSKGTLFGQPFDMARPEPQDGPDQSEPKAYAEFAHLLKYDGTHIPGIVNPTQLGCWIQRGKI